MQSKNLWVKALIETNPDDYKSPSIEVAFYDDAVRKSNLELTYLLGKTQFLLVSEEKDELTITEVYDFFGKDSAKNFICELIRAAHIIYQRLIRIKNQPGIIHYVEISEDWLTEFDFDIDELRYQFFELIQAFPQDHVNLFCREVMRNVLLTYYMHQQYSQIVQNWMTRIVSEPSDFH